MRVVPDGSGPHTYTATLSAYDDVTHERAVVDVGIDAAAPSLFAAMEAAGERPDLPVALAAIFGGEIDFNSELQPGDRFRLLVEKVVRTGESSATAPCSRRRSGTARGCCRRCASRRPASRLGTSMRRAAR